MRFENLKTVEPILKACVNGLLSKFGKYFDFATFQAKEAVAATFTLPHFKLRWIKNF